MRGQERPEIKTPARCRRYGERPETETPERLARAGDTSLSLVRIHQPKNLSREMLARDVALQFLRDSANLASHLGDGSVDSPCGLFRTYWRKDNIERTLFWRLLSSGHRAKMTADSEPCPWLVPEDIPHQRLQRLAGGISWGQGRGESDPATHPVQASA